MTELVMRNYWLLEVIRDVGKYIEEYDLYQRIKNRTEAPVEKLITNKVLEKPWRYLIVDFIMKLLVVVRKDAILVVCNRLLKIAHFVATKGTLVEGLARLFKIMYGSYMGYWKVLY